MDKGKIAGGILSLTLIGLAIGYVVATGYLTLRYGLSTERIDFTLLAREYRALGSSAPPLSSSQYQRPFGALISRVVSSPAETLNVRSAPPAS